MPSVTLVYLVYNRRDELRESLQRMLASEYDGDVDVIVVDNASTDGSGDMVRAEFPDVQLLTHEKNVGVSGWNIGFAAAKGDWVLALDDDCYLQPDGLREAVTAALEYEADLVSFRVRSTVDPSHYFDVEWYAGLFGFWGCAVLMRTPVLQELEGYDPEIFLWSNETELTIRLLDRGYRHLRYAGVVAEHMKKPPEWKPPEETDWRPRKINNRHYGYTAGKLLQPRDAVGALVAIVANELKDGIRNNWRCAPTALDAVAGFVNGLKHRDPVRPEVSRCVRENYWFYAPPWKLSRGPRELLRALPRELKERRLNDDDRGHSSRRDEYFRQRERYYPKEHGVLQL
jgi:GT2 family glycosyltransferase